MTPEGWSLRPLANLVAPLRAGVSVNSEDRQRREGEFGVLKTSALSGGQFNPDAHKTVLIDELDRVKTSPAKGDILISRMNTPLLVGENAFVPEDFPDLFLPDRLWQMRVSRTSDTSSRWLAYFLQLPGSRDYVRDAAGGTSGSMKNVSQDAFLALEVLCPPLPEQKKIAEILGSVDEAIQATQAVIDQTRKVKQGLLQQLLTRGIGHTRFKQTKIGEIPESWRVVPISEVASVEYGISKAVSQNTDPSIGWPILTGANLTLDGTIDLSKIVYVEPPKQARFFLQKGDLLLNWRSGSPAHVGKTALFDLEGIYTYASFILRIRSTGGLYPEFGHLLLNHLRGEGFFARDVSVQVNFKMNAAVFRDVVIPCPGFEEQVEIANTVARLSQSLLESERWRNRLRTLKNGLMQDLLTGRVRVAA